MTPTCPNSSTNGLKISIEACVFFTAMLLLSVFQYYYYRYYLTCFFQGLVFGGGGDGGDGAGPVAVLRPHLKAVAGTLLHLLDEHVRLQLTLANNATK